MGFISLLRGAPGPESIEDESQNRFTIGSITFQLDSKPHGEIETDYYGEKEQKSRLDAILKNPEKIRAYNEEGTVYAVPILFSGQMNLGLSEVSKTVIYLDENQKTFLEERFTDKENPINMVMIFNLLNDLDSGMIMSSEAKELLSASETLSLEAQGGEEVKKEAA